MFEIKVVTSDPPPDRYRWQIVKAGGQAAIETSPVSFRREQTAREAGLRALARFLSSLAQWAKA